MLAIQTGKVIVTGVVTIHGLGSHSGSGEMLAEDDNAMTRAEAQAFKRACCCFGLVVTSTTSKASTGVSPHRYQLNTRIGKAQELLLTKGESLSMVAVATGFADQSHFTRTFKRVTGATPHEWHQNRTL